jgi:hypothetical protein
MKPSRALVLAVLVYVALDLSSPAIPGAFVFEAGESVESVARARTVSSMLPAPVPLADPSAVVPAGLEDEPQPASAVIAPAPAAPRRPPARTAVESPPPSEDPH